MKIREYNCINFKSNELYHPNIIYEQPIGFTAHRNRKRLNESWSQANIAAQKAKKIWHWILLGLIPGSPATAYFAYVYRLSILNSFLKYIWF